MLNVEIEKLTNSIENAVTGEIFETLVLPVSLPDKNNFKKKDWVFDWKKEYSDKNKFVHKLVTSQNQKVIHGLLSLSINQDHVFMHLIESATFNKGSNKLYWV